MKRQKYFLFLLVLFVLILSLLYNLHTQLDKHVLRKSIVEINDKYSKQININQQHILYQRFVLNEKFYSYNPFIRDIKNNDYELSEVIDSCSIVYRITSFSCSTCVKQELDNYLASSRLSQYQFIVICTNEQVFFELSRYYRYSGTQFFFIKDDYEKMSNFNELFPSIFLFVDNNGFVRGSTFDNNIQFFLEHSSLFTAEITHNS